MYSLTFRIHVMLL